MGILVTGAKGFIGRNLIAEMPPRGLGEIYDYDIDSDPALLDQYCKSAIFVFHLAGVNRPQNEAEFMEGNYGFTSKLLDTLKKHGNSCPIMIASSIQAELQNPYGQSKKASEDLIFRYGREEGVKVLVYRFPNVFGKWSRPEYNSVLATFCHRIARDLPIEIHDPDTVLTLVYIDDLVDELIRALEGEENREGAYCAVPVSYKVTLGRIAGLLYAFRKSRKNLSIPDLGNSFEKKLYATYLSFLPENAFSYILNTHTDDRGSFAEFLKSPECGQVSVNVTKTGAAKGNHWHHTKTEKFLVVHGDGVISFREVNSDTVIEYPVSGRKLEVLDIPPGYTHKIENSGDTDLVTLMWASEVYDPGKPDTYYLEV